MHKPTTYYGLRDGQKVRVIYEGIVTSVPGGRKALRVENGQTIPSAMLQRATAMMLEVPTWQIGDVVVIRFNGPGSTPYTYVRDSKAWPGVTTNLTDDDVTEYVERGLATHLVRAGEIVPPKPAETSPTLRPRPFPF